ncbi:MAG: ZIP family metal transporter [Floccifex sp.]
MIWLGIWIPFLGTALGAACVYFLKNCTQNMTRCMSGIASGVMVAASIWSLILPAIEESSYLGSFSFIPALVGLWLGVALLLILDHVIPHMHVNNEEEGPKSHLSKTTKLILAVTLHNVPEGMAVGVVFAGVLSQQVELSFFGAFALAIGIAIQNFPEGAILSLPLKSQGMTKHKAFVLGALSGIVEPLASIVTILFSKWILVCLPYFLSFAAGAMLYVVVEELVPEMSQGNHSNWPTICFMIGFTLMMVLDITLG